jgi:hypothetical protein
MVSSVVPRPRAGALVIAALLGGALARPARAGDAPPAPAVQGGATTPGPTAAGSAAAGPQRPHEGPPLFRPDWGLCPLEITDEYLLTLTHLSLGPSTPRTVEAGAGEVSLRGVLAKTIYDDQGRGTVLDAETVHAVLEMRLGLLDALEASAELPLVWRWEGVLDPVIEGVERLSGSVRGERQSLPQNTYRVGGVTDEGSPFDLEDGVGLAKAQLGLKYRALDGAPWAWPAVAIEALVALPTGTPEFGTHGVDIGARLSIAKRFGDFIVYGGGALWYVSSNDGPIFLYHQKAMVFDAVELEIEPWLGVVYQMWGETPSVRNLAAKSGFVAYQGPGLKAVVGRFFADVAVIENGADVKRSADIIMQLEVGVSF